MANNALFIIIGAVGLFALCAFFVLGGDKAQKHMHERAKKLMLRHSGKGLATLAERTADTLKKKERDSHVSSSLISLPSISRLREKLDGTGREISLMQYLGGSITALVISFLLLHYAIGLKLIIAVLLAVFLGLMIPHMVINRWINKRLKQFMLILPDAVDLIVRGLRSGLPVTESVNTIRDEIPEPVKSVFADISQSVRIGMPFEEALAAAAKKLKLNEFNFFVISVALQRETGGNLAEILENLSSTIRARAMMKLKIKAITSEARMSAYIVGALPFFVATALSFLQPGYFAPLVDDVRGNIALGGASFSFCFGMFIMFKMAKFQI